MRKRVGTWMAPVLIAATAISTVTVNILDAAVM